jgi:hypothetical protein
MRLEVEQRLISTEREGAVNCRRRGGGVGVVIVVVVVVVV